jgi:hypothetical protein
MPVYCKQNVFLAVVLGLAARGVYHQHMRVICTVWPALSNQYTSQM